MPWTEEDTQAMDAAAGQAAKELPKCKTADQVATWFAQWYLKAGHKRLGRLLVEKAKNAKPAK